MTESTRSPDSFIDTLSYQQISIDSLIHSTVTVIKYPRKQSMYVTSQFRTKQKLSYCEFSDKNSKEKNENLGDKKELPSKEFLKWIIKLIVCFSSTYFLLYTRPIFLYVSMKKFTCIWNEAKSSHVTCLKLYN